MVSTQSAAIFTHSWSLYDLITTHNYMFHQEIYAGVETLIKLRHSMGGYHLLDLGCGNTRYLAPSLKRFPPGLYEGVDLSETALSEARDYLAGLPGTTILTCADLLKAVESTDRTWDVLFTGFAVHHLMPEEKRRFFCAAGRCLSKNGWLIMVDVVREKNQDRTDYLNNYLRFMREKWIKVPREQLEEACKHVHDHDYPETLSTLQGMAAGADLKFAQVINCYAQHYTLLFSRTDLGNG